MMKRIFALCLSLLASGVSAQERIPLDSRSGHIRWEVRPSEGDALPAVPAIVPGCVFASYVAAGVEADPNFGDNAYRTDKSRYDRNFRYTGLFPTPPVGEGRTLWLRFEGVNRKGTVRLNGHQLGHLDGFMQPGDYDITRLVAPDGENRLEIEVEWVGYPVPNFRSPTYISSAGWDWMPYAPGLLSGITDDVYLSLSGDVRLIEPWVRTKVPDREHAKVELLTDVENRSDKACEGVLRGEIRPGGIAFSHPVRLEAGERRTIRLTEREVPGLAVEHPQLWWPNGMGDPALYTCRLAFETDGRQSDARTVTFGIREYGYEWRDGIFRLKINGEPVYVKGGNWGMSEWLLRCRGEEYDTRVALHRHMHFNMIRNWIGSTTDEEFYDACDRHGIMVWDDFWLNSHPNLPHDLEAFQQNAVEKIKRLRNHPSIAVWCGDNEGVPLAPLNEWLREDVKAFDGGDRWYQPISREYGFSGSGPWVNAHPIWYFTAHPLGYGEHKLDGWGFRTEIGSAVFTNYESYKKFMPEPERWPASPGMLDKHFFGNSAGNARPTRYFAAVEYNYGKAAGAEDFCRKAQLLNIEVNKAMYEGWQHHLWNDASGIQTWMSQSAYPSFVWQTYDYYYDLNGAYWGVRKACEPLHIQWSYADNTVKVVNASGEAYNGLRATAAVYNMDGSEVKRYAQRAALSSLPNTAVKVMTLPFPEDRNLARGKKTVASSSENDDSHAAKSVTDGNTGSSWRSGGPGEQWVMVDLGAPTEFSDIVLTWESEAAKAYEILASDDAEEWRTVYTSGKPSTPIDRIRIDPVTARYVKLQGTAPHDDWQLVLFEMELYGPETPAEELSPVHFIRLRLTDDAGNLLSENFYWRSNRLGDYRALNDLEPAKLDVRTKAETVDGKRIIRATVTNRGRSVAFAVRLMPVYASTGEQILPVIMDDNYFTLLRGETRKVDIEIDESLLGEDTYKLVARPYND